MIETTDRNQWLLKCSLFLTLNAVLVLLPLNQLFFTFTLTYTASFLFLLLVGNTWFFYLFFLTFTDVFRSFQMFLLSGVLAVTLCLPIAHLYEPHGVNSQYASIPMPNNNDHLLIRYEHYNTFMGDLSYTFQFYREGTVLSRYIRDASLYEYHSSSYVDNDRSEPLDYLGFDDYHWLDETTVRIPRFQEWIHIDMEE
ncbi:hypothetical protein MM326_19105 [Alkalihalobacillus sp. LMS6]|uniref:hypothetical protein n=1 Tax=Alkalihalobacillus sp. LMS6 TaxID=2924034 RepID=UPI0020D168D0|nr:hypothetical protein [Alkalihalobacillus sp. LMS6]UTR06157.1 hypothetical protein MM326_19105 [Alkalihalobacillus sp. LMS6]